MLHAMPRCVHISNLIPFALPQAKKLAKWTASRLKPCARCEWVRLPRFLGTALWYSQTAPSTSKRKLLASNPESRMECCHNRRPPSRGPPGNGFLRTWSLMWAWGGLLLGGPWVVRNRALSTSRVSIWLCL